MERHFSIIYKKQFPCMKYHKKFLAFVRKFQAF